MSRRIIIPSEENLDPRLRHVKNILSACYQCGLCSSICPYALVGEQPITRKIVRSLQLGLQDEVGPAWLCALCMLCQVKCPKNVPVLDAIIEARRYMSGKRRIPERIERVLWDVYEVGNSWGVRKKDRAGWCDGIKLAKEGTKVLLYAGCVIPYDKRLHNVARSVARILSHAGVKFGVLGEEERCCGDVVYSIGEEEFLEEIAAQNIDAFRNIGVETIVTISPHCYNIFKNVYPKYGGEFEVLHYTEMVSKLFEEGKINVSNSKKMLITFHDPCYLGRYNKVYEPPRKILESIPGIELTEMRDNKESSLCCGGGGGRIWMGESGKTLSDIRIEQALETGASVLATSCPYCVENFEASIKKLSSPTMINVLDVAEIVWGFELGGER